MKRISVISFLFASFLCTSTVFGEPLDKIRFVKISSQDSRAVIKTADNRLQVVKPGDAVVEGIKIKEIFPGRITLEENTANGLETIIVRLDNNKTRIERLRKRPDQQHLLTAPSTSPVPKQ